MARSFFKRVSLGLFHNERSGVMGPFPQPTLQLHPSRIFSQAFLWTMPSGPSLQTNQAGEVDFLMERMIFGQMIKIDLKTVR